MAAIVGNAENRQIGNNIAYSQSNSTSSAATDNLHSLEVRLDPSNSSAKAVDLALGQTINGLSHLDKDLLPLKTDAKTKGSGSTEAGTKPTNYNAAKPLKDLSKEQNEESVKPDYLSTLSQSIQNKSPLVIVDPIPSAKNEEKVEIKVPLDSKSNHFLPVPIAENISTYDTTGTEEESDLSQNLDKEQNENKSEILESQIVANSENKSLTSDMDRSKESPDLSQQSDEEQKQGLESKVLESQTNDNISSSADTNDKAKPPVSENGILPNITSTLEEKNKDSHSDLNDNKLCKSAENSAINGDTDNANQQETNSMSSKYALDDTQFIKDFTNEAIVDKEKVLKESNSKNISESSKSLKFSMSLSENETDKSSKMSNIPELLSYCSPCRVVVQDFFKELNIDLLELSRNFPPVQPHRKRLKPSQTCPIAGKEQFENTSSDSLAQMKETKCYTEDSKRRKNDTTSIKSEGGSSEKMEVDEDNLPLVSVRNNLIRDANIAADIREPCSIKDNSSNEKATKIAKENLEINQIKGDNLGAVANVERSLTNTTLDVPETTLPTNPDPSDPNQQTPLASDPAAEDLNDPNNLGLKSVSISSRASVLFPTFTRDNSENIVFHHSDKTSKLNGQLGPTTCGENSATKKLSPPKCKFHGPNSSPVQNLYKCKKCGLIAKSLSDIQSHMAGSHSEFSMYRCPFCIPPLRVKHVSIFNNRPIEFEVLRESSHKHKASSASSTTKTTLSSTALSAKRTLSRPIHIQREKRRKLNNYYQIQREIKSYNNKKVSCQYCLVLIYQSNMLRHQNSKKCAKQVKDNLQLHSTLDNEFPKKYKKVKCDSCQKNISRTNVSKHSKICPRKIED